MDDKSWQTKNKIYLSRGKGPCIPAFTLQKKKKSLTKYIPFFSESSISFFKTLVKLGFCFLVFQENFENFQNGHCMRTATSGGYWFTPCYYTCRIIKIMSNSLGKPLFHNGGPYLIETSIYMLEVSVINEFKQL